MHCPFVFFCLQRPLHLNLVLLAFLRALHGVSGVGSTQAHILLYYLEDLLVQVSYRPALLCGDGSRKNVYIFGSLNVEQPFFELDNLQNHQVEDFQLEEGIKIRNTLDTTCQ